MIHELECDAALEMMEPDCSVCFAVRAAYQRAREDAAIDVVHSIWRTEGCSFEVVLQDAVDTARNGFRR